MLIATDSASVISNIINNLKALGNNQPTGHRVQTAQVIEFKDCLPAMQSIITSSVGECMDETAESADDQLSYVGTSDTQHMRYAAPTTRFYHLNNTKQIFSLQKM